MAMEITLLYIVTFVDLFAVGLVVPLINLHVTAMGGSHFVTGLMGSFYSGLQLFSSPIMGSLSDVKGRKPILLMTLLCCSVAYFCFGIVNSIFLLLTLRVILGIFKHTQTLAKAYVTDIAQSNDHSDIYGKMAAISGAGITLGPLIGGHILEDYPKEGFAIACSVVCILFVLNAGIVYLINPKKTVAKTSSKSTSTDYAKIVSIALDSWKKSIDELKIVDWHNYWDVFLLKGLVGLSMSIFYSNYSPLLKHHYGLSPKLIGYTISFQGIIGALCSFFIKYINNTIYANDKNYTLRNLHCFVMLVLTFIGLLLCNQWVIFIILLVPLATGNAILRLVTLEIIIQKCPENQRGSLIGASNSVRSISGIIGPFVAGTLSELVGIKYVLLASLASACVGTMISNNLRQISNKRLLKTD